MRGPFLRVVCVFVLSAVPIFGQSPRLPADDVERRADSILSQMTLDEKIDLISGTGFATRAIPRLGVPAFQMSDGPIGSRNFGPSTAVAGGIGMAASWDPALVQRQAKEIGRDARARGAVYLLGPGVNIYRAPMNGRNFEYFGEDPFLASRIAVAYINGIQSTGVAATIKHYMGNNSEFGRNTTDSVIDERAKREIYLPVFEAGVKEAHVASIMDSYNLADGEHLTQSSYLNTEVAKKQWGFNGVIMSDWGAVHDALGPANGGLDLEMPTGQYLNRLNLRPLIDAGKVPVATIDDKVRRILRVAVEFGWLDQSHVAPDISIPRYNQEGRQVSLQGAREGIVLLKNDGNLLPLSKSKIRSIAVIGPDAYPAVPTGGGSGRVNAFHAVSILEGLSDALGASAKVHYHRGIPSLNALANRTDFVTAESNGQPGIKVETFDNAELSGAAASTRTEPHVNIAGQVFGGGTFDPDDPVRGFGGNRQSQPSSDRWTSYYVAKNEGKYDIFVQSRDNFRLLIDDKSVIDSWEIPKASVTWITISLSAGPHKVVLEQTRQRSFGQPQTRLGIVSEDSYVLPEAKELAATADAVIVAVGFDAGTEGEGADRGFALLPGQDQLIKAMAAANKKTIVVVTSGGSMSTSGWIDRVPALLQSWYAGEEGGTALADILLGNVNPSGRLPITWEKRLEDNPTYATYYPEPGSIKIVYKEGIFVGYRGYEHNGTKPLFPFGYGLSYTTFKYSNLSVQPAAGSGGASSAPLYEVTFDVTNTGRVGGADVAQVYVGEEKSQVPRPAKELKGFQRVDLRPGETRKVTIPLNARAFTYYDVDNKRWHADAASFSVFIGRSVEDIPLQGKIKLAAPIDLDVSH